MGEIVKNDIDTLLHLYFTCYEQGKNVINTVLNNCARIKAGHEHVKWCERQINNIARQMQYMTEWLHKLTQDIHLYYLDMIQKSTNPYDKLFLTQEYTGFLQHCADECARSLHGLEENLRYLKDIIPINMMRLIIQHIAKRVELNFMYNPSPCQIN